MLKVYFSLATMVVSGALGIFLGMELSKPLPSKKKDKPLYSKSFPSEPSGPKGSPVQ